MSHPATVSSALCIAALSRLGFDLKHRGEGVAVLARGPHTLVVPETAEIPQRELDALLTAAGVTRALFARLVAAPTPRESGVYTRRDR
jgi:hypothetical protein